MTRLRDASLAAGALVLAAAVLPSLGRSSREGELGLKALDVASMLIRSRTDKASITLGEEVRMVHSIGPKESYRVRSIHHRVTLIGEYDMKGSLRAIPLKEARVCGPVVRHGFPHDETAGGTIAFNTRTPREQGYEVSFKPEHIGVFMLESFWYIGGGTGYLRSSPIILTVDPPVQKDGSREIKPEWLPNN